MRNTALLVVDMQHGFLDPGEALETPPARKIVPAIQRLLDVFRRHRLPVVFTECVYSERVPLLVGELHPEHKPAVPGTPTGCVLGTVVGAFNREYRITVVEDAVATLWPEIQRATPDIIGRAYGRVVSSKHIADEVSAW